MNAPTQLPPEEFVSQNELICDVLLRWEKIRPQPPLKGIDFVGWRRPTGGEQLSTPSFTTWADAGLILEALRARGVITSIQFTTAGYCAIDSVCSGPASFEIIPLAIRDSALKYIGSLP